MKVKCGAYTNHQLAAQTPTVRSHKPFLFRRTQTNPQNVGLRRFNLFFEFRLFDCIEIPERRRKRSYDRDSWESAPQVQRKFIRHARFASVQKMANSVMWGAGAHLEHQIWTENAFHLVVSLNATDPHGWHAIRSYQERMVQDFLKLSVALGLHDAVNACDTDIAARPRENS